MWAWRPPILGWSSVDYKPPCLGPWPPNGSRGLTVQRAPLWPGDLLRQSLTLWPKGLPNGWVMLGPGGLYDTWSAVLGVLVVGTRKFLIVSPAPKRWLAVCVKWLLLRQQWTVGHVISKPGLVRGLPQGGLGSVRHWYLSFHFVFSRLVLRLCKYLILISRFVAVIHRVDHERILQMWPVFSAHCRAQMFSNQTFLCLFINIPCPRCPFFTPVTVHVSQLWANTSLYMKSTFVGCH